MQVENFVGNMLHQVEHLGAEIFHQVENSECELFNLGGTFGEKCVRPVKMRAEHFVGDMFHQDEHFRSEIFHQVETYGPTFSTRWKLSDQTFPTTWNVSGHRNKQHAMRQHELFGWAMYMFSKGLVNVVCLTF